MHKLLLIYITRLVQQYLPIVINMRREWKINNIYILYIYLLYYYLISICTLLLFSANK